MYLTLFYSGIKLSLEEETCKLKIPAPEVEGNEKDWRNFNNENFHVTHMILLLSDKASVGRAKNVACMGNEMCIHKFLIMCEEILWDSTRKWNIYGVKKNTPNGILKMKEVVQNG
jgi:hypothetical protein